MRKYFLISIALFACYQAYGQESYIEVTESYFAVGLKLKPQEDKSYFATKDPEIKALVAKNGVDLRQTYPNFTYPESSLFYDLRGNGNKESSIKDLMSTGKFDENYLYDPPLAQICSCPAPVSVNDYTSPNRPLQHWPLDLIEAKCAWSITQGNPGILIGVADTEFRMTHEDLVYKIQDIGGNVPDLFSHGTGVSSVAAANTNNGSGIASIGYNSKITARRIPHFATGNAEPVDIRSAILDLYQSGASIINVSWNETGLSLQEAQQITQGGTTLVLAGGNNNSASYHSVIAEVPGVIVVSGVDSNNMHGPTGQASNQYIDICAPGKDITVAHNSGNSAYTIANGTSFAAPFVSGTIALMKSVNSSLTPAQIEDILKKTTDPIADGGLFSHNVGRLNAYKAVLYADTSNITNPSNPPFIYGPDTVRYGGSSFVLNNPPANFSRWTLSSNPSNAFQIVNSTANPVIVKRIGTGASAGIYLRAFDANNNEIAEHYIISCPPIAISGATLLCRNNQLLFSVTNAPAGFTWNKSSNLILSSTVNSATLVSAASNVGSGELGWVSINLNGVELTRKEIWIGYPDVQISGSGYVSSGSGSAYTSVNHSLSNAVFFSWYMDENSPTTYEIFSYGSYANVFFYANNSYRLHLEAGNSCGCGSAYMDIQASRSTPISPVSSYPNPVKDILYIEINSQNAISNQFSIPVTYDIHLYDQYGILLRRTFLSTGKTQFDLSNLTDGVYFLHIYDGINPNPEMRQIIVKH